MAYTHFINNVTLSFFVQKPDFDFDRLTADFGLITRRGTLNWLNARARYSTWNISKPFQQLKAAKKKMFHVHGYGSSYWRY